MPRPKQFDEKEVLEKAIELFWRDGFSATSMQMLVTHLGINRASLYDTFGSKDALFQKALEHYMNKNEGNLQALQQNITCAKAALRSLFVGIVVGTCEDSDTKGCFIVNTITEMLPNKPSIQPLLAKSKEHFELFLKTLLAPHYEDDEKASDIASYLYTLLNGLQVVAKVNPDKEALIQTIDIGLQVLEQ